MEIVINMWYIVAVVVIIFIYMYMSRNIESFATKREKENAIIKWFDKNGKNTPTYTRYKQDITGSNVAEYDTALTHFKSGKLSSESLSNIIY